MMEVFQAFAVLGLDVNKRITLSDIKQAYRNKAKVMHPDKGGGEKEFKELVAAYELLIGKTKLKRKVPCRQPVPVRVWVQYQTVSYGNFRTTSTCSF